MRGIVGTRGTTAGCELGWSAASVEPHVVSPLAQTHAGRVVWPTYTEAPSLHPCTQGQFLHSRTIPALKGDPCTCLKDLCVTCDEYRSGPTAGRGCARLPAGRPRASRLTVRLMGAYGTLAAMTFSLELAMLAVPLRTTEKVYFTPPLKLYIQTSYQEDAAVYAADLQAIDALRDEVCAGSHADAFQRCVTLRPPDPRAGIDAEPV